MLPIRDTAMALLLPSPPPFREIAIEAAQVLAGLQTAHVSLESSESANIKSLGRKNLQ